ncbi:MAG TPA: BON domain-containing protein [Candidatus Binatia bacterium]|nr:BON domain-containing protein [Candidatus Binatia bacterium]
MSSSFSSALANLDGSIDAIQFQVDCLRAALEVDDDQLGPSLTDARYHAAMIRDLVHAERPDAKWMDRRALEQLIHELELAARARRNQQRRTRLLELANELDAGRIRHRFEGRTAALNTLRLDAIKELRSAAAASEQEKDLPGPNASDWLHWACSLEDDKDAQVLAELRRDFSALERFASEMEDSYWVAGERVEEPPAQFSEPPVRAADAPVVEPPASRSRKPFAPVPTEQNKLPPHVKAQFDRAIQSGSFAEALAMCYGPPGEEAQAAPEKPAKHQEMAVAVEASDFQSSGAPHVKYCENCGSSFPSEFYVCPLDNTALRLIDASVRAKAAPEEHPGPERSGDRGARLAPAGETHASSLSTVATLSSTEAAAAQPAERSSGEASREPAELEFERLKAILEQRQATPDEEEPLSPYEQFVPRRKQMIAWGGAAAVVVLSVIFAVAYHFHSASSSQPQPTAAVTAPANPPGVLQDSDIQKDVEQRLAVLKDSSIQATVQDGVVTLVGRSPSKGDLVKAESLASEATGVKEVTNKIQIDAHGSIKKPKSNP